MSDDKEKNKGIGRRDFFKAAATTPVVGAFAYSVYSKNKHDKVAREEILSLGKGTGRKNPNILKRNYVRKTSANDRINVAFIGVGGRGNSHMRNCGFIPEGDEWQPWEGSVGSEDLNLECTAVCDLFEPNLERAVRNTGGRAKIYHNYQELLAEADVDAVVIATSDNAHAPIAIAAAEAGKHVGSGRPHFVPCWRFGACHGSSATVGLGFRDSGGHSNMADRPA